MPTVTEQTITAAVGDLKTNLQGAGSQALVLQGHANLIDQQSTINLQGFENLKKYETDINGAIGSAKTHANTYINLILPKMIGSTTNIDSYFNLQNALGVALRPGISTADATKLIGTVEDQATQFKSDANDIANQLHTLNIELNGDAANFKTFVTNMNTAVNGDNGVMDSIDHQMGTLDATIAGASAGIALAGLTVVAGGLMVATGAVAELITAGTSTTLVVAGVGVAAVGVAGGVAAGITLANALDAKGNLISKKSSLEAEVAYALGIKGNFSAIAQSCIDGSKAAGEMANAWDLMGGHLKNLIGDLESGRTNTDAVRTLFLSAAQGDVKDILSDNSIIQRQLAGVQSVDFKYDPKNPQTLLPNEIKKVMKLAA